MGEGTRRTVYDYVKSDPDPTPLWQDVVISSDRTLNGFQMVINIAMELAKDSAV